MLNLSIVNPQIAIAGRVLQGKTDMSISGAIVAIVEMPETFRAILSLKALQYGAKWGKMSERVDRKISRHDGYFYFTNLPPGEYRLEASLPNSPSRYNAVSTKVQVSSLINGQISTTMVDIVLSPTGINDN